MGIYYDSDELTSVTHYTTQNLYFNAVWTDEDEDGYFDEGCVIWIAYDDEGIAMDHGSYRMF